MDKQKKNEEIQSRREFFKKAAKAALPVVGAVVLSSLPIAEAKAFGCGGLCQGTCQGSCMFDCDYTCKGDCKGTCEYHCTAMQAGY